MNVPGRETAPGPGSAVVPSISRLLVFGMQNTAASVASVGVPGVTAPAGLPFSVIVVQVPLWKQPVEVCPGQKTPVGSVLVTGPVVSGERSTGSVPTKVP